MLEIALAGLFVAAAFVALGRRGQQVAWDAPADWALPIDEDMVPDLPCPWCRAETKEDDHHCGSCGQRFG